MTLAVANAPCSYGVFEARSIEHVGVPTPEELVRAVGDAGYDGIDLGPPGYLGATRLVGAAGMPLAGAFVELPFLSGTWDEACARLDAVLDALEHRPGWPAPRPTLADAGSPERAAAIGRAAVDRSASWTPSQWRRVGQELARVVDRCRERGFEPTFHPHAGSYVEAPWEIDELVARSDVGLCLDTGHLLVGGGDVHEALTAWGERINHVHLKDVDGTILASLRADRPPLLEMWRRGTFCAFGEGIVPLAETIAALRRRHYDGWIVVEQDVLPEPRDRLARVIAEQPANRRHLAALGV